MGRTTRIVLWLGSFVLCALPGGVLCFVSSIGAGRNGLYWYVANEAGLDPGVLPGLTVLALCGVCTGLIFTTAPLIVTRLARR